MTETTIGSGESSYVSDVYKVVLSYLDTQVTAHACPVGKEKCTCCCCAALATSRLGLALYLQDQEQ